MKSKTIEQVNELKKQWCDDPCWDIEDTEGFEQYHDELKKFRKAKEVKWEQERINNEKRLDGEAAKLGLEGLYRMILELQEYKKRSDRAIEALMDEVNRMGGDSMRAYKILRYGNY